MIDQKTIDLASSQMIINHKNETIFDAAMRTEYIARMKWCRLNGYYTDMDELISDRGLIL